MKGLLTMKNAYMLPLKKVEIQVGDGTKKPPLQERGAVVKESLDALLACHRPQSSQARA